MHASSHSASSLPLQALKAAGAIAGTLGRHLARSFATLRHWHELSAQRRALLALDDRALKDIGISRADVDREASRWFWDDSIRERHPASQAQGAGGWLPGQRLAAEKSDPL